MFAPVAASSSAPAGSRNNREWRERYHGIPGYTSAAEGDLGTAIEAGEKAGGALALMDDAWWGASVPVPGKQPLFVLNERSDPFSIVVDQSGARYLNESESYIDFGHHLLERDLTTPANPSWLVVERRHRQRYMFGAMLMAGKAMRENGISVTADTLDELGREDGRRRGHVPLARSSASTGSPAAASTRTSAAGAPSTTTTTATRA